MGWFKAKPKLTPEERAARREAAAAAGKWTVPLWLKYFFSLVVFAATLSGVFAAAMWIWFIINYSYLQELKAEATKYGQGPVLTYPADLLDKKSNTIGRGPSPRPGEEAVKRAIEGPVLVPAEIRRYDETLPAWKARRYIGQESELARYKQDLEAEYQRLITALDWSAGGAVSNGQAGRSANLTALEDRGERMIAGDSIRDGYDELLAVPMGEAVLLPPWQLHYDWRDRPELGTRSIQETLDELLDANPNWRGISADELLRELWYRVQEIENRMAIPRLEVERRDLQIEMQTRVESAQREPLQNQIQERIEVLRQMERQFRTETARHNQRLQEIRAPGPQLDAEAAQWQNKGQPLRDEVEALAAEVQAEIFRLSSAKDYIFWELPVHPDAGEIIHSDQDNDFVMINRGYESQGLTVGWRRGFRFSVFERIGADYLPKGIVEIREVFPDHSEAWVVQVYDRRSHPILSGDLLRNPVYFPRGGKVFAIAGDLTALVGGYSPAEIREYLETYGNSVSEAVTVETDILIIGEYETDAGGTPTDRGIAEMLNQAKILEVPIIPTERFLADNTSRADRGFANPVRYWRDELGHRLILSDDFFGLMYQQQVAP